MANATCPNCETMVFIGSRSREGDLYTCPGCDADLELVWLDPPELEYFYEFDDDESFIYDDLEMDVE